MEPPFDSLSSESWDQKDYTWHPHRMQARRISNRTSKNKPRGCKAPLVCQVEGCNNDLSQLKGYHRRYKICTCHLKTEFIMKDGIKQRFCQQCGRFHDICEFDGLKRSCRVRLRRHNERRRKKPNNNTTSCSESAGTGRTNSNLTMDCTLATGGPASLFNEDYPDPSPLASPLFSSSNQHQYFPVVSADLHHPGIAPPPRIDSASTRANDVASDCATETTDSYPLLEVYRNFKQNCDPMDFLQKIESKEEMMPTIPEMMSPQKQYMGAPLTMPLTSSVVFGRPLMDPVAFLKPDKTAIKPVNCKRDVSEMLPWAQNSLSHRSSSSGSNSDNLNIPGVPNPSLLTVDPIRKNEVLDLYNNVIKLTSVSLKLYSCTPCSLPTNLRLSLVRSVWGGWCPESCIREGCVYLNFDIFRPANNNVLCLEDVVNRLIHYTDSTFWKHITMMVQLDSYSMLVSSGVITRRFDIRENPSLYPNVKSIKPVCVLHTGSREFTITGANLSYDQHISIHCRIQGKFLAVASVENKGETETYCFSIADQLPVGAVKIEISKSGLVCRTMTVLSLNNKDVVEEIEAFSRGFVDLHDFLSELGLIVELCSWIMEIRMRNHVTIDKLRVLLQQLVRSQNVNRLSFKCCSKAEFNGLLYSAQRLYSYCDQQGLSCTKNHIWPVVWLAIGGISLEKTITSILDDVCALIVHCKQFKMISLKFMGSLTVAKLDENQLVSSM